MNISATLGRVWRLLRWVLLTLVILGVAYIGWGMTLVAQKDKDDAAVAAIHAQKLNLADVDGSKLPPAPDKAKNDSTVAGIDANNNGIRDDVELAIFQKYPGAANEKVRAAELQYAMTEQMFLTRVFDTATWKAVAEENGRAQTCLIDSKADRKEVESFVFNTGQRNIAREKAYAYITGYGPAQGIPCDVTL